MRIKAPKLSPKKLTNHVSFLHPCEPSSALSAVCSGDYNYGRHSEPMCFNKTRSLCSSLTAEGRLVHNCDGPRSDAAQTSGSSVSTEVWTGVCSITGAIHFFQRRASVSDVGLGLFFPCLPGGIQLTSVRLLLFMKRRSSRLENLKNVDEFWLHSFLRDPFFSPFYSTQIKKKKRFLRPGSSPDVFSLSLTSCDLDTRAQSCPEKSSNQSNTLLPVWWMKHQTSSHLIILPSRVSILFWAVLVTWHTGWSIILVQV